MPDIKQLANTIIRGEKAITFPLEIHSGRITDANGHFIAEIRGWGWIQYLDHGPKAEQFQDDLGQWIVDTLNQEWEEKNK